MKDIHLYL